MDPRTKFQFFAVQGVPFPAYTSFVTKYQQRKEDERSVVLDKHQANVEFSLVSWRRRPPELTSTPVARVAALPFRGIVADSKCTELHRQLLQRIKAAGLTARNDVDYRVVMSSAPRVMPMSRANELLVELRYD
jgi:hypothetical protein